MRRRTRTASPGRASRAGDATEYARAVAQPPYRPLDAQVIPRFAGDGFGFKFPPVYKDRPERSDLDALAARLRITV